MNMLDMFNWILKALWMQRTRTLLSIVGFAIGISAMVLLSALGEGLRVYVLKEFKQFGTHILTVIPGKNQTFGSGGVLSSTRPLTLDDAVGLQRLPGVEYIVPMVMGTAQIKLGNRSRYSNVMGVGGEADVAWQMGVARGTFLPDKDLTQTRPFAVLGPELAEELFGNQSPLGETLQVGGSRFRVVGVTQSKGDFMGNDFDDAIFIPTARASQLFNRESLMGIDVVYSASVSTAEIERRVSQAMIGLHGVEDFTIITQDEMMATMDNILRILKYAGAGLGAISLLVGGVGIATILMITVTERTAEVGLLRAIGSTRRQIRNLFLGEAIVLGFLGGLAGVLLVVLLIILVALFLPGLPIALEPGVVIGALLVSMLIGLIAGVNPAMKATGLSPIDALRAE